MATVKEISGNGGGKNGAGPEHRLGLAGKSNWDYSNGQQVSYTGSPGTSNAVNAGAVLMVATTDCYFKVGGAATAAAGSVLLPGFVPIEINITAGDTVSVIRKTTDGALTIIPRL